MSINADVAHSFISELPDVYNQTGRKHIKDWYRDDIREDVNGRFRGEITNTFWESLGASVATVFTIAFFSLGCMKKIIPFIPWGQIISCCLQAQRKEETKVSSQDERLCLQPSGRESEAVKRFRRRLLDPSRENSIHYRMDEYGNEAISENISDLLPKDAPLIVARDPKYDCCQTHKALVEQRPDTESEDSDEERKLTNE